MTVTAPTVFDTTDPAPSVLDSRRRADAAADPSVGAGNLLHWAVQHNPDPDAPLIHSGDDITALSIDAPMSIRDLYEESLRWSAWYRDRGVGVRDVVALQLDDTVAYFVHQQAIAQIGAIALCIKTNASPELAAALARTGRAELLVASRGLLETVVAALADTPPVSEVSTFAVEDVVPTLGTPLDTTLLYSHIDDDPVALLHSSGTTGIPKAVIHTNASLLAGPKFRLLDHTEAPGALIMTALPQSHLGCIAYTAYAVLAGTPIVAVGDRHGERLLELIDRYRPTSVMAFGHCYPEIASIARPGAVDSVDVWVSMGDAVHQGHVASVLALRDPSLPNARFLDRLGTTELGWGVLMKERTIDAVREDRCNGRATGSAEVAVLRENGSFADVNEIGLLGARGPAVTPGYWNNSTLTYEFQRGGYWLTGDLAYTDTTGNIYQVDRWVDVVHTSNGPGWTVWMEEVVLADVPEIEDCAVVGGIRDGENVTVCVACVADPTGVDTDALLARVNAALGAQDLVLVDTLTTPEDPAAIPLGVTGKVLKRELRIRFEDMNRLDGVYTRHLARRSADADSN